MKSLPQSTLGALPHRSLPDSAYEGPWHSSLGLQVSTPRPQQRWFSRGYFFFLPENNSRVSGFQKVLLILKKIPRSHQNVDMLRNVCSASLPVQLSRSEDFKGHFLAEINIGAGGRGKKHGLVEWKRKLYFSSKRRPDPSPWTRPLVWRTRAGGVCGLGWRVPLPLCVPHGGRGEPERVCVQGPRQWLWEALSVELKSLTREPTGFYRSTVAQQLWRCNLPCLGLLICEVGITALWDQNACVIVYNSAGPWMVSTK